MSFILPFKRKPQISEDCDRNSLMDNDSDGEKDSTINFVIAKPPIDVTRTANHDYNSNSSLAASLHNLQVHSATKPFNGTYFLLLFERLRPHREKLKLRTLLKLLGKIIGEIEFSSEYT